MQRDQGEEIPYQIQLIGIYLVIEANNGIILMWDRKTSIFIKLSPEYKVSMSTHIKDSSAASRYSEWTFSELYLISCNRVLSVASAEIMTAMQRMTSP